MPDRIKKLLDFKSVPIRNYIILIIVSLELIFSVFLYRIKPYSKYKDYLGNTKQVFNGIMDVSQITDKQKGTFINIKMPGFIDMHSFMASCASPYNPKLILLPDNRVLYTPYYIVFNFDNKIPYSSIYLSFLKIIDEENCGYFESPVLLSDKTILIFGNGALKFDYKTDECYPIAKMQNYRYGLIATKLPDNKILIIGGYNYNSVNHSFNKVGYSLAELYDPKLNKFTTTSKMYTRRADSTATLLKNGKVLIVGGNFWKGPYAELYDYKTGKFYPLENKGKIRAYHTATLLPDGRVVIIGGTDNHNKIYSDVEIYDPKTNEFKEDGRLINPRWAHAAVLLKPNKIFVAGSFTGAHNAEIYDLKSKKSSIIPDSGKRRFFDAAAIKLKDGNVLVISGCANGFGNSVDLYVPQ